MKILQRNLNRSTFIVWEMKRNVSVVRLIVATQSSSPPASQPACFLPDAPLCWSLCHLAGGAYTIRLLFVSVSECVSSHSIVESKHHRRNLGSDSGHTGKNFPKYGALGSILSGCKWWPLLAHVMMSSHFLHNEVSPPQISLQYH